MIDDKTYLEITHFLHKESTLQDERNLKDWMDLLTPDASYYMPERITREKEYGNPILQIGGFINDDRSFLEFKVRRDASEYAWAENPPSRTRHFVTNVEVEPAKEEDEVNVTSNVLLFVHRYDDINYQLMSYARYDVLRKVGQQWKLARRKIVPDQTTITMDSISFFL